MARKNYWERYKLIIEKLKQCPCTYREIEDYLLKSNMFQILQIKQYSIRTLQRDIKEIENEFDVYIKNTMGRNGIYRILELTPEYI
ncbi:hypothetical protein [Elizabethkingia meningoseptica]|uniref:hypothetical protein n=1 Tax=Elizabethkingia meningoseptica TaxID=238 RepID=UPI003891AAA0